LIKQVNSEVKFFVTGYILFLVGLFGILLSAQPIFTYFLFVGLVGLALILVAHFIRHMRLQKSAANKVGAA
jgi:membrane protein implicated in regulation of membrane protease activity